MESNVAEKTESSGAPPPPPEPGAFARWRSHVGRALLHGGLGCVIISGLIAITVRDRYAWLAPPYYWLPLQVCTVILLVNTAFWFKAGRRNPAILNLTLALAMGGFVFSIDWRVDGGSTPAASETQSTATVAVWNIAGGFLGRERVVTGVEELDSDVAILLDAGDLGTDAQLWGEGLPTHTLVPLAEQAKIALLVKGSISSPRVIRLTTGTESNKKPAGTLALCRVSRPGVRFVLAIADFEPGLFANRAPLFEQVMQAVEEESDAVVLVGGFGTPRHSVHFDLIRSRFRNAFESVGTGLGVTWPIPLPGWEGDQVWFDEQLQAVAWRSPWTSRSSSAPVVATITQR